MTYMTRGQGDETDDDALRTCRSWCDAALDRWTAGDAAGAWAALEEADAVARDPGGAQVAGDLAVLALAARATVLLRAERANQARATAQDALAHARTATAADHPLVRDAVLDARVTAASARLDRGAPPAQRAAALDELDDVAREAPGTRAAARAVNNALLERTGVLDAQLRSRDVAAQVTAWTAVADARRRTRGTATEGVVLRQAVDLAFLTGAWARGWEVVTDGVELEPDRSERIALHAKASLLAWERGDDGLAAARSHGARARDLSVAVDIPWVRLYAHLGGVVADLASGVPPATAVDRYARCLPRDGHRRRPDRAWRVALLALDAGASSAVAADLLARTGTAELVAPALTALLESIMAERDGRPVPPDHLAPHLGALSAPQRGRAHLVLARLHLRSGRRSAAALELLAAGHVLQDWPGRVRDAVVALSARTGGPRRTPAQRRVLDLVVEGLTNEAIAERLGCSPRTVAVHVSRLLATSGTRSRTELAVTELRRRFAAATGG